MKFKLRFIALAAATMISTSAPAENLMSGSFDGIQDFSAPGALRIFPSGSFFQSVFLNAAGTVMFSFSAVCSTFAPGNGATRVILLIDGVAAAPTGASSNLFCSTRGPASAFNPATHTFVIAKELTAGNHDIQMRVEPFGAGARSRIRHLSLLAWR